MAGALLVDPPVNDKLKQSYGSGQVPQGGVKGSLPSVLVSIRNNVNACDQDRILDDFQGYLDRVKNTQVILKHKRATRFKVISGVYKSRYFEQGRIRIKKKIFARLGHWAYVPGVLLTLTFDTKRIGLQDAWAIYGSETRRFLNSINQYRRRRYGKKGKKWRRLSYLWVVEEQRGTGYPHLHIFFPNLKWLASKKRIRKLWGWGRTNVIGRRTIHVARYICKYLTKFAGWSVKAQAMLWAYRGRLYALSRSFYARVSRPVSEWRPFAVIRLALGDIYQLAFNLRNAGLFGYTVELDTS